ncbi:MAG TPA: BadF/BadG/BcrA/BcrD ATPase family protein, partial [Desulfobacteria bacterium]|nr:BadF/BadG/BcrA/BcrD ATPase family protein [Desulfobacteria bacterium]
NMAAILGITLKELSSYEENPVDLSATCAIFGESELVGKIIEGNPVGELAAGVNYTIYKRVKPMLIKLMSPTVIFTGGVAQNEALSRILQKELEVEVVIPKYPQFNGAIGCCVIGGMEGGV